MTRREDWFSPFVGGLMFTVAGWIISLFYDGVLSLIVGIPLAAVFFAIILIMDQFKSILEIIKMIKILPVAFGIFCGLMIQSGNEKAFVLGVLTSVLYMYVTYDLAGFSVDFRT